jgi:hypothetical protein
MWCISWIYANRSTWCFFGVFFGMTDGASLIPNLSDLEGLSFCFLFSCVITNYSIYKGTYAGYSTTAGFINPLPIDPQTLKNLGHVSYSFLSMLTGLIDGDGHISITRDGLFIRVRLIIELNIRDLALLQKIHTTLGIGTLRKTKVNTVI